jgi:hypothetical protein
MDTYGVTSDYEIDKQALPTPHTAIRTELGYGYVQYGFVPQMM